MEQTPGNIGVEARDDVDNSDDLILAHTPNLPRHPDPEASSSVVLNAFAIALRLSFALVIICIAAVSIDVKLGRLISQQLQNATSELNLSLYKIYGHVKPMPEDIHAILDVSEGVKIDHSRLSSSLIILYRDVESMAYVDLDTFLVQVDHLVHGSAAPWGMIQSGQRLLESSLILGYVPVRRLTRSSPESLGRVWNESMRFERDVAAPLCWDILSLEARALELQASVLSVKDHDAWFSQWSRSEASIPTEVFSRLREGLCNDLAAALLKFRERLAASRRRMIIADGIQAVCPKCADWVRGV